MTMLGWIYYQGTPELEASYSDALKCLEQGMQRGSSLAASILGWMNLRGEGVPVNHRIAFTLLRRGLKGDQPLAYYGMGVLYRDGLGVIQDMKEAERLFKKSVELGSADAAFALAMLDPNAEDSFKYLIAAASGQHPLANFEIVSRNLRSPETCNLSIFLLDRFFQQTEIDPRFKTAEDMFFKLDSPRTALMNYLYLAEQGHPVAIHNAAKILTWCDRSSSRSIVQWHRLIKTGDPAFQTIAGDALLSLGYSDIGINALSQSVHTGKASPLAFLILGWMYHRGMEFSYDPELALRYYRTASMLHPRVRLIASALESLLLTQLSLWRQLILVTAIILVFLLISLEFLIRRLPVRPASDAMNRPHMD